MMAVAQYRNHNMAVAILQVDYVRVSSNRGSS